MRLILANTVGLRLRMVASFFFLFSPLICVEMVWVRIFLAVEAFLLFKEEVEK